MVSVSSVAGQIHEHGPRCTGFKRPGKKWKGTGCTAEQWRVFEARESCPGASIKLHYGQDVEQEKVNSLDWEHGMKGAGSASSIPLLSQETVGFAWICHVQEASLAVRNTGLVDMVKPKQRQHQPG